MPWTVKKDPELCSVSEPYAVIKLDDGTKAGCHDTQESAEKQVAALYAQEGGHPNEYDSADPPEEAGMTNTNPAGITVNFNVTGTPPSFTDVRGIWRTVTGTNTVTLPNYQLTRTEVEDLPEEVADEETPETPDDAEESGAGDPEDPTEEPAESDQGEEVEEEEDRAMNVPAAQQLLRDAVKMHQMHLDDPDTATPESQVELMDLIEGALDALEMEEGDGNSDHTPEMEEAEGRRAAPKHDTSVKEGTWDAGLHVGRLPSPMSTSVANRMYAAYDSDQVTDGKIQKQHAHLPHHEVSSDGSPGAAILNGVRNALARLNQTNMPSSDREAARTHLRAHLDAAPESDSDGDALSPENARARVHAVPRSSRAVTGQSSSDHRNLPEAVLDRLRGVKEDVGVIDRVGRAACELRFRPEVRVNQDGTLFVHGYATVYDYPYDVAGGPPFGWSETIVRDACRVSVQQGADVRLLINHEGIPLARTRSGTLRLESDDLGLYSVAPSLDPRSPTVQSLMSAMSRGDLDEMSFAFRVKEQEWNDDYTERQITEVMLYDVSMVTYPANPATVSSVRQGVPSLPIGEALLGLRQAQVRGLRRGN